MKHFLLFLAFIVYFVEVKLFLFYNIMRMALVDRGKHFHYCSHGCSLAHWLTLPHNLITKWLELVATLLWDTETTGDHVKHKIEK